MMFKHDSPLYPRQVLKFFAFVRLFLEFDVKVVNLLVIKDFFDIPVKSCSFRN